jgi:hypothetical protein
VSKNLICIKILFYFFIDLGIVFSKVSSMSETTKETQLKTKMSPKEALKLIGGLSNPSKMPCHGYSIPASRCKIGAKMRNVEGSICSVCYALKGFYAYSSVKNALERRFASLSNPLWVDAMVIAIAHYEKSGYFRWHDSGDIQSLEHLEKICEVCETLPEIRFWLPTREYSVISKYIKKHGEFPENLTVRLSGLMLNGKAPLSLARKLGLTVSGAHEIDFNCNSFKNKGKCLDCRLCWDKGVEQINYKKH